MDDDAMDDSTQYVFAQVTQRVVNRHEVTYDLVLRQEPKHSRMCGVGENGHVLRADRRPVDPPPIIQLKVHDPSLPESEANAFLQNPYYFMYASLVHLDSSEELHLLCDDRTRATTGSVLSSLYHLKDVDNTGAGFFVFPDLSIRIEGSFRLKFSLFEIVGKKVFHCNYIYSQPFTVYSAKRFPGMEESTFLSRSLADQGMKIRIRKEIRIRRRANKRKESAQQDAGGGLQAEPKRARQKEPEDYEGFSGASVNGGYKTQSRTSETPPQQATGRTSDPPLDETRLDALYAPNPWWPVPTRECDHYHPMGYYYPHHLLRCRGTDLRTGPGNLAYPPRSSPRLYMNMPPYPFDRCTNLPVDPSSTYGQPQRRWIPGGHPSKSESVPPSPQATKQVIPPIPLLGGNSLYQPSSDQPDHYSGEQRNSTRYTHEVRRRDQFRAPDAGAPSLPPPRVTPASAYSTPRGHYPYHPPTWYDPFYSSRSKETCFAAQSSLPMPFIGSKALVSGYTAPSAGAHPEELGPATGKSMTPEEAAGATPNSSLRVSSTTIGLARLPPSNVAPADLDIVSSVYGRHPSAFPPAYPTGAALHSLTKDRSQLPMYPYQQSAYPNYQMHPYPHVYGEASEAGGASSSPRTLQRFAAPSNLGAAAWPPQPHGSSGSGWPGLARFGAGLAPLSWVPRSTMTPSETVQDSLWGYAERTGPDGQADRRSDQPPHSSSLPLCTT